MPPRPPKGDIVLKAALSPFRSARSTGRTLLALLVGLVPLAGPLWLMGWMLDHQRNLAWGRADETPSIELSGDRLVTGMWATLVMYAWTLPLSLGLAVGGSLFVAARIFGPLSQEMSAVAATPSQDPYLAQQQIGTIVADAMVPAFGLLALISIVVGVLVTPIMQAAIVRYNLYRTPREGIRFREVLRPLSQGGMTTVKATAVALAPLLIELPLLALSWRYLAEAVRSLGVVPDPAGMAEAGASYLAFTMITGATGLLASGFRTIVYSAWGEWACVAYDLEAPAPEAAST
jgi:hypothetical protein